MGLKAALVSRVSEFITGENRQSRRREKAEQERMRTGAAHVVAYFHQANDPYSHLAVQGLQQLQERYAIEVRPYLVGPPADWATPERTFLNAYAREDGVRLARVSGLSFPKGGAEPGSGQINWAQDQLAKALHQEDFPTVAIETGAKLWSGDCPESAQITCGDVLASGEAAREKLGHFMSAMFHYGGEWYWGIDRLHYLEARLRDLGLQKPNTPDDLIWLPPPCPLASAKPPLELEGQTGKTVEYFLSFRSPYTYIATQRAKALADAYGATLKLRFVLPMVMRGLAVPPMKSRYFALDTAREARRLGVPFGRICDPLGKPVERGYSLLPWAMEQGRGYELCLLFMQKVWSEGVDAGSDKGLAQIVSAAGLDWSAAKEKLGNDAWREEAEANRLELLALGHWGVPCFKCGDVVVWGQDRLWVIEEALRA